MCVHIYTCVLAGCVCAPRSATNQALGSSARGRGRATRLNTHRVARAILSGRVAAPPRH